MDLPTTKIVVAVLLGVIRFVFGILPVKLYNLLKRWEEDDGSNNFLNQKRHYQVNAALAFCQSFGGGVLFATCFLHMMLEVYRSTEELKKYGNITTNYPLSQLTICLGFFFVYFLEELSHWFITRFPEEPLRIKKKVNNYTKSSSVSPIESATEKKINGAFIIEKEYEKEFEAEYEQKLQKEYDKKQYQRENEDNTKVFDFEEEQSKNLEKVLSIDNDLESIVNDNLSLNSEVMKENAKNLELNHEEFEDRQEEIQCEIKNQQQLMRCILVILALSLHAVFEGIAIGLQQSSSDIWYLFVAITIHSATILFCMGLELLLAKVKIKYIALQMFALALASPFGVIIGLVFTLKSDMETKAKSTAVVLLEGLSAGTILYITFFEVLNREKERRVCRMSRALCISAGFTLMAVLQYFEKYP